MSQYDQLYDLRVAAIRAAQCVELSRQLWPALKVQVPSGDYEVLIVRRHVMDELIEATERKPDFFNSKEAKAC